MRAIRLRLAVLAAFAAIATVGAQSNGQQQGGDAFRFKSGVELDQCDGNSQR